MLKSTLTEQQRRLKGRQETIMGTNFGKGVSPNCETISFPIGNTEKSIERNKTRIRLTSFKLVVKQN